MTEVAAIDAATKTGKAPRWLWIALLASGALNLAFVGLAAGSMWHLRAGIAGGPGLAGSIAGYAQTLPAKRRNELRGIIAGERAELRALRQQARRARAETSEVFLADPFDKARFDAAQSRQIEAELKVRHAMARMASAAAPALSAEERKGVLEKGLRWRARLPGKNLLDEDDNAPKDGPPAK